MGLFEKTQNLVEAQLKALLEPGASIPGEQLKGLILEVDRYRRDLARTLAQHTNEKSWVLGRIGDARAKVALWRGRRELARERGREDLAAEADARARLAEEEAAALDRQRVRLAEAVANLTVSLKKVERTAALLWAKRRGGSAAAAAATAATAAAGGAGATPASATAGPDAAPALAGSDPIEDEFLRLEVEEVTRHIDRRLRPDEGGAPGPPPAEPPPSPRTSER